jgi:hypothetical protein
LIIGSSIYYWNNVQGFRHLQHGHQSDQQQIFAIPTLNDALTLSIMALVVALIAGLYPPSWPPGWSLWMRCAQKNSLAPGVQGA